MLKVEGLKAGYGRIPILHGIDLTVDEGECIGIWGHNGMGKTTLLSAIMGYRSASGGSIAFKGEDVTRLPTHKRARKGLGLVPQGRQIFPRLTVRDNLRMGSASMGNGSDPSEEVIERFPRLKSLLDRPGGNLSGGEQQLLSLARCLCSRPKLVMLDEPTEGIQPSINEEISETLQKLRVETGLTLILVEQRREFIASLASRVLIMRKGAFYEEMSAQELLAYEELH